jgi:hypothetical protein
MQCGQQPYHAETRWFQVSLMQLRTKVCDQETAHSILFTITAQLHAGFFQTAMKNFFVV